MEPAPQTRQKRMGHEDPPLHVVQRPEVEVVNDKDETKTNRQIKENKNKKKRMLTFGASVNGSQRDETRCSHVIIAR